MIANIHIPLGGGFRYVLFSPLPGEMIRFDEHFSDGLQPEFGQPFGLPFPRRMYWISSGTANGDAQESRKGI